MRFMSNEAPHGESVAKDEFELIFALPENSTVCGYAADIEGKMVEANVIEKQVARAALETSIRANKGASLAEKTSGNLFRVRIFPVLPGIARVIKVAFSKTLGCDGVYNFPLKSCADSTSIKINVFSLSPNSPLVTLGAERYSMTQQSESNATQYEFSFSTDLHSVNTTICIHTGLELIDQATIPAFTERGDEAIDDNDFTFFYAPLVLNSTNIPQSMSPSVVVVLWDTSQSRLECNKSREVEALLFLLKNLNPSFIDVVCFSNQVTSYERFSIE
ncbi:hypothetical protein Pelo_15905 [Pelomyxa schiedti]|nr:hypothetical protein Pelo_15905 [Pelomyxa schiedti]